jgi:hypothetical protein
MLSSGLLLGLVLGLGVLVLGGLSLGLIFLRNLAQGPEAGQVEELLGLAGEDAKPDRRRHEGSDDPYSARWKDLEEQGAVAEANGSEEEAEAAAGGVPATTASESVGSERPPASDPAPKAAGEPRKTEVSLQTKAARPKGKTATVRLESPRKTPTARSTKPVAERAPETVIALAEQQPTTTAEVGRRTPFSVAVPDPPKDQTLRVTLRMQCASDGARWRRYTMARAGRTVWERRINFDIEDRGLCKYYFTAQAEGDASSSSLGSKRRPFEVKVR